MKKSDLKIFRKYVIHGIIHTDMAEHFSMVSRISAQVDKQDFNPEENLDSGDFIDFFGLIIHTCDLYAPSKQFDISKKWAGKINEEFLSQWHEEGSLNIPQTSFFKDLDKLSVMAGSESFFVFKIVKPLWELTNKCLEGDLKEQVEQCEENLQKWKKICKEEKEKND